MVAQLAKQNAKSMGTETVNGFATNVYEVAAGAQTMRAWVDTKYCFVVKMQSHGATLLEVKSLSVDPPAASLFALPATCGAAGGPAAPTEADRIAAETGGSAANYANAIMPPGQNSGAPFAATFKVVHAGTMAPIVAGFQVGLDLDQNSTGGYHIGMSASGTAQFSGGAIKEVTTELRSGALLIAGAPKHFRRSRMARTGFGPRRASSQRLPSDHSSDVGERRIVAAAGHCRFDRYSSMAAVASRRVASTALRPRTSDVVRNPNSSPSAGRTGRSLTRARSGSTGSAAAGS
jgi:hypothetical protein